MTQVTHLASAEAGKVRDRLDSKLEAEGAEFLVLGHLLVEGVQCFKAYTNFPGYDLIAVNSGTGNTARIQVKSRWATDYGRGFPLRNLGCDFLVFAALNRGYRYRRRPGAPDGGRRRPDFFVFPIDVVAAVRSSDDAWGKVFLRDIPDVEFYRENWPLIAEFLGASA